jgi:hypothetical protein
LDTLVPWRIYMKKYIVSGAALLLGALASPAYCTTVILAFSYIPTPPGTGTITYTPTGSAGVNPATLDSFLNIPFNSVTASGGIFGAGTTYTFTSSGTAFDFVGAVASGAVGAGPLTNTGSFTTPDGTATGTLVSLTGDTVTAYTTNSLANIEVGFSNNTGGTINASLEAALGLTGAVTVSLVQDVNCEAPPGGAYPVLTGMACAAGYNASNGSSAGGVDSQYLEVSITSAVPEPQSSLLLGCALVAVGSLARKRRQKI